MGEDVTASVSVIGSVLVCQDVCPYRNVLTGAKSAASQNVLGDSIKVPLVPMTARSHAECENHSALIFMGLDWSAHHDNISRDA